MSKITKIVDRLVQQNAQFGGKDVIGFIFDYKEGMLRCGISDGMQVISFNRISTNGLQGSIHELRQQHPMWAASKQVMKTMYTIEDSLRVRWTGFKKGLKVLKVLVKFGRKFGRLSPGDQGVLVLDKVVMFLRSMGV